MWKRQPGLSIFFVAADFLLGSGGPEGQLVDLGTQLQALNTCVVTGDLKRWHAVTLTCDGPAANQAGTPSPFLQYRFLVTFSQGAGSLTVPGYFAADGNAGESLATTGNKWRAHFTPDNEGVWHYTVSMRQGGEVAVDSSPTAGSPIPPDGETGSFTISATDKMAPDLQGKGILKYTGQRYYKFSNGDAFLKQGPNSPENLLAFADFIDTVPNKHTFSPHVADWQTGDPVWQGSKGKGLLGAINYLSSQGMNVMFFLTQNVTGDGNDVWPWVSSTDRTRFSVRKLAQWGVVFGHMQKRGIVMHVVFHERENDRLLDGGNLGTIRKLYFRELIARFGHHPGVQWNLGEETTLSPSQIDADSAYVKALDVYDHPVVVHNYPWDDPNVFGPQLGDATLDGVSLHVQNMDETHAKTLRWINDSAAAGKQWVVALDEIGDASVGLAPDANDANHDGPRRHHLWGNLMAGGAGTEHYFGSGHAHTDLNCEDYRSRANFWPQARAALEFFRIHLPSFRTMQSADNLTSATDDYVLAIPGQVYAIYMPNNNTRSLDLGTSTSTFEVRWYKAKTGGALQTGSVTSVTGPGVKSLGVPPATGDWVALVSTNLGPPVPTVTRLRLINADTDAPVAGYDPIPAGATINLATLPATNLNIEAMTTGAASVVFHYDGVPYSTQSSAPYAFAGQSGGNFAAWTPVAGSHTVNATPYPQAGAGGTAGTVHSVTFTVIHQSTGPTVTKLRLINATTDQPIAGFDPIAEGATVNLSTVGQNLNIEAVAVNSASVKFRYDGVDFRTESTAPYAFNGDTGGDYASWTPALGAHTVTATPYSATGGTGAAGQVYSVGFNVVTQGASPGPGVTKLRLINADTGQPVAGYDPIPSGATINLATLPTQNLNMEAVASGTASVVFHYDGALFGTRSTAPYALAGQTAGNFAAWTPTVGSHSVSATPYAAANGGGAAGSSRSVSFTVTNQPTGPAVLKLRLINANTDLPIAGYDPILNGATIRLSGVGQNLNIEAIVSNTASVVFRYDGSNFRTESTAPYAFNGDNGGNYHSWTPTLGPHTVTATPYSAGGGTGAPGPVHSISFTVTN